MWARSVNFYILLFAFFFFFTNSHPHSSSKQHSVFFSLTHKKKSESRNIDKQVRQARREGSRKKMSDSYWKSLKKLEKRAQMMIAIMRMLKLIMVMCKTYPNSINEFYSVIFFFSVNQDTKMKQGKRQTRPPAGESAADAAQASLLLGGGVSACTEIILSCWVCWSFSHLVSCTSHTFLLRRSDQHPLSLSSLGRRTGRTLSDSFLLPHSAKWRGGRWQRRLRISGSCMRKWETGGLISDE